MRVIQDRRKELGCEFTDRIKVGVETDSAELKAAVDSHNSYIAGETLADKLSIGPLKGLEPLKTKIGEAIADLFVRVAE